MGFPPWQGCRLLEGMTLMKMRYGLVACLVVGVVLLCFSACSTTKIVEKKRTLPFALVATELPERPDAKPISPSADWAKSMEVGDTVPEGRAGVLMSTEKAIRAARYVVVYNELRDLYQIDIRTWGREREIYQRHLDAADDEIERWKKNADRTWWENNVGYIAVGAGLVLGAAITIGILEATQQVIE